VLGDLGWLVECAPTSKLGSGQSTTSTEDSRACSTAGHGASLPIDAGIAARRRETSFQGVSVEEVICAVITVPGGSNTHSNKNNNNS
jgi:hypothetical protein